MRGEHRGAPEGLLVRWGSSPHARGARRRVPGHPVTRGLIPACAGSTYRKHGARLGGAGLIPACAGSTRGLPPRGRSESAHPRMRGEHTMRKARGPWLQGSSPHARGALVPGRLNRNGVGLIPACAGSTRSVPQSWAAWRAHPRMRGEHKLDGPLRRVHQGSSPHARGAPRSQRLDHQGSRLIPACAGSTGRGVSLTRPGTAHPRMRGEHHRTGSARRVPRGSSPHARGAPLCPPLVRAP